MDDSSIINIKLFATWFSPAPIYDAIGSAALIYAGIIPFMIALVAIFRYFSEASEIPSGKARLGEGAWGVSKSALFSIAYAGGGGLILVFAISFAGYFYQYGSFSIISSEFAKLVAQMKATQSGYDHNFIQALTGFAKDTSYLGAAPLAYAAFFVCAGIFIGVYVASRLAYAMLFGMIYLWGFIVIPTVGLKGSLNLTNGWTKSMLGLVLWPVVESMTYLFAKFTISGVVAKILASASGPLSMFTYMHAAMAFICLFLAVLTVGSFYFTARMIQNNEALTGLATPFMAAGAAAGYYVSKLSKSSEAGLGGMMPSSGGSRGRDSIANALSGVNSHPVQSVKNMKQGLGNMASKVKSWANEGRGS